MKKIFALSILLAALGSKAQDGSEPRGFIRFTTSLAIPVADFYSTALTNEDAGMAKTGTMFSLNGGAVIRGRFGLAASASYSRNAVHYNFLGDEPGEKTATAWEYYTALAGPMLVENLAPDLNIYLTLTGGAAMANSPRVREAGQVIFPSAESRLGFAWSAGGQIHYALPFEKRLTVSAGFDFLRFDPKFIVSDATGNKAEEVQKIRAVNIGLGIGWLF